MTRSPDVAVITMARDEGDLLPLWVSHYARHVGIDNLVVLDDNSVDGSTEGLGCTVHRVPELRGGPSFEPVRMRLMNGLAAGLLAVYDYVVFVDVDEFLVTDPTRYPRLPDLIEDRGRPEVLGVMGLNVVHVPSVEPEPLDLGRPLLEQRGFAKFTPLMCKPSVKRINAGWAVSSHGIKAPYSIDPELFMIHLKFADRSRLAEVAALRNAVSAADGRAQGASWGKSADHLVEIFDSVVADVDPAAAPEFDPATAGLDDMVIVVNDRHRTPQQGQVEALRTQPLVRIPERLRGAV
ncbi:glycosyltransferase family 2 protein [Nocardioides bizhenqiangii]|uniref:Glycosyltransferase family 2 protein n=1 Tax=Nocardioides bizhenqiangii TaxID=3095076 RepID=A0ABZ0ZMK0_9ACTN|nr:MULTISPECIES: glycosyltransferase family 2 protein [unclassified Nocardioides]MDZ5621221.1 glycosyltransferase family 2 protein [Nocardioides sp. HM23]WQQ25477.1 glycosyltransferase family 2 protein [Nocardioides sp. HM61]